MTFVKNFKIYFRNIQYYLKPNLAISNVFELGSGILKYPGSLLPSFLPLFLPFILFFPILIALWCSLLIPRATFQQKKVL